MQIGAILAGRFLVERAASTEDPGVLRAADRVLGGAVTLRLIELVRDGAVERFLLEAATLAGLDHPALARHVAHGHVDGRLYLAAAHVEGDTLQQRLLRGPLVPAEALALVARVAEAAAYAHRRGVGHLDLHPRHLILRGGSSADPVLALPGGAWLAATARPPFTPDESSYLAPERLTGARPGPATDSFGLGVLLFCCLAGHPPFLGATPLASQAKILLDDPPRLPASEAPWPPRLAALVASLLARDPQARPADLAQLALDLADPGLLTPAVPPPEPAFLSSRERTLATLLAIGDPRTDTDLAPARSLLAGARVLDLAGRVLLASFPDPALPDALDQAARAARAIRERMPQIPLALVTGYAAEGGLFPTGEALDRAAALAHADAPDGAMGRRRRALQTPLPYGVRLDALSNAILSPRWSIDQDDFGFALGTERPGPASLIADGPPEFPLALAQHSLLALAPSERRLLRAISLLDRPFSRDLALALVGPDHDEAWDSLLSRAFLQVDERSLASSPPPSLPPPSLPPPSLPPPSIPPPSLPPPSVPPPAAAPLSFPPPAASLPAASPSSFPPSFAAPPATSSSSFAAPPAVSPSTFPPPSTSPSTIPPPVAPLPSAPPPPAREVLYRAGDAAPKAAALASLFDEDRKLGHRLAARWLTAHGASPEELMEHLDASGDRDGAQAACLDATREALIRGDLEDALSWAERGEGLGERSSTRDLLALRAEIHRWLGQPLLARKAALRSIESQQGAADLVALAEIADASALVGDARRAQAVARRVEAATPDLSIPELAGHHLIARARCSLGLLALGFPDLADDQLGAASLALGPTSDPLARGWLLRARALRAQLSGFPAARVALSRAARAAFLEAGHDREALAEEVHQAFALLDLGLDVQASTLASRAAGRARRAGLSSIEALGKVALGLCLGRIGSFSEARAILREAAAFFSGRGNKAHEGRARIALAAVLLAAGDQERGQREAERACLVLDPLPSLQVHALSVHGQSILASGDADRALGLARAAQTLAEARRGMVEGATLATLVEATALHLSGQRPAALALLTRAEHRILDQAATIADATHAQAFLRVPEHARILDLARLWSALPGPVDGDDRVG